MTPRGKKRIVHVATCCGRRHVRWQFKNGTSWKSPEPFHCHICGSPLEFELSDKTPAAASLRYYMRRSRAWLEQGLTTRGAPRKRSARAQDPRTANLAKWRRRAERFRSMGLTTRGTAIKHHFLTHGPTNPQEIAWRDLRASMGACISPNWD